MKNFDINRFWQTMRWTLFTEKRTLIAIGIASLAGSLLIQMGFTFSLITPLSTPGRFDIELAMRLCAVAYSLLLLFFASRVCSNVRSRRQRATALMLPASKEEKFVARLLFCLVVLPLLALAAVTLGTCTRMFLELLAMHHYIYGGWGTFFGILFDHSLLGWVFNFWFLSLFLLAGVFFRRVPFLWMWGVIATATTLLSIVISFIVMSANQDVLFNDTTQLIITILLPLFTVFNVWLSYRLYKRLQIVQNNVFNV